MKKKLRLKIIPKVLRVVQNFTIIEKGIHIPRCDRHTVTDPIIGEYFGTVVKFETLPIHEISIDLTLDDWKKILEIAREEKVVIVLLRIPDNLNNAIKECEKYFIDGDWLGLIKACRGVLEELRSYLDNNKERLMKYFENLGNDREVSEKLYSIIRRIVQNLYDYASKPLHREEKETRKLMRWPPTKSDAVFLYGATVLLMKSIFSKIQKK